MAKKSLNSVTVNAAQAASFTTAQLESAERAANAIRAQVGAVYICSLHQRVHSISKGSYNPNVLYTFECSKTGINVFEFPYDWTQGMYVAKEEDFQGPLKPMPVNDHGLQRQVPNTSYKTYVAEGNILMPKYGDAEIRTGELFALECTEYTSVVSCRYETKEKAKAEGFTKARCLLDNDGNVLLRYHMAYLFKKVPLEKYLKEVPANKAELKEALPEEQFNIIEPWLLDE